MNRHVSSGAARVLERDAPCSVHSVFDHLLNVRVGDDLLLLAPADRTEAGDCPFGAALAPSEWQRLDDGLRACTLPGSWSWSRADGTFTAGGATVLAMPPASWSVAAAEPLPRLRGPVTLRMPADAPVPGLLEGHDVETALAAVRGARTALAGDRPFADVRWLLGRGPGLTPSGDDVLVGLLAGLSATGRLCAETVLRLAEVLDRHGRELTTEVSVAYLRCAARGEFARPVGEVVRALDEHRDSVPAVSRLLGHGHTSGADLLWGLIVGLEPTEQGAGP